MDTTQIGMCRVARSPLRCSRMRQPSMSGRKMSSVITEGWYSRVIASAAAPVVLTRPLKPVLRADSRSTLAKARSFSTIKSTLSPLMMSLRSSSAGLLLSSEPSTSCIASSGSVTISCGSWPPSSRSPSRCRCDCTLVSPSYDTRLWRALRAGL